MARNAICLLAGLLLLGGCTARPRHMGLSPDGYGFVDSSTHLPPPDHLLEPGGGTKPDAAP